MKFKQCRVSKCYKLSGRYNYNMCCVDAILSETEKDDVLQENNKKFDQAYIFVKINNIRIIQNL